MARRLAEGLRRPPRDVRDRGVRGAGRKRATPPVLQVVAVVALCGDTAGRPFGMTFDEGLEISVGDFGPRRPTSRRRSPGPARRGPAESSGPWAFDGRGPSRLAGSCAGARWPIIAT